MCTVLLHFSISAGRSSSLIARSFLQPSKMGSVVLPHLVTGWHVDQAIMGEEERLVVIRFGRDWDADCMRQDEVLYSKSHASSSHPHSPPPLPTSQLTPPQKQE